MIFASIFRNDPELVHLPAGERLFAEGEPGDHVMYVLVAGTADIVVRGKVVEHVELGAILGELAVIESQPRSATVIATSESTFARIDEKRFRFLVSETPHFAIEVMRIMAQRLRNTDAMLPD